MQLSLKSIRIDGGTQSRVELNNATVEEYAEAMHEGATFPPVVVFFDGATHWLADGFHRYFGADHAGLEEIAADVRQGTQADAQLFSFGVNADHGLRRTNADKRKAVTGALQHPVSCKWSDNQIAKHCGVSREYVLRVRQAVTCDQVTSEKTTERTYTTKHGSTAVMNTANVGKSQAKEKPKGKPVAAPATEANHVAAHVSDLAASNDTPEYDGPSEEELRSHALQEQADREALDKLMESDDKLATAYAEIKRLNSINAVLESRLQGMMNKDAEQIRLIKSLQRKLEKLEKVTA